MLVCSQFELLMAVLCIMFIVLFHAEIEFCIAMPFKVKLCALPRRFFKDYHLLSYHSYNTFLCCGNLTIPVLRVIPIVSLATVLGVRGPGLVSSAEQ